jgi:hypothetical protein
MQYNGAVVIAVLTLTLAAAPAPSPAPTALPVIARVVSRPLCAMLRQQAGPAIAGLVLNDRLTQAAVPVLNRFYNDRYGIKSARAVFDVNAMRDISYRMAHNLETIDAVLATLPTPLPSASPNADDAKIAALRRQFNDVEDAQRNAINVISGLAETDAMNDLQSRGNGLNGADGPSGKTPPPLPEGFAGLPPTPAQAADPRLLVSGIAGGSNAITPFVDALGARYSAVTQREEIVSESVLRATKECAGHPEPVPSPSASPRP